MTHIRVPVIPARIRWAAVLVVAGVVFATSILIPPPAQPVIPARPELIPLDKWRHILGYTAFAGTLTYAVFDWDRPTRYLVFLVLSGTILYGFGIELWQSLIPQRYFSINDAYANALGSLVALPLLALRNWLGTVHVPSGT